MNKFINVGYVVFYSPAWDTLGDLTKITAFNTEQELFNFIIGDYSIDKIFAIGINGETQEKTVVLKNGKLQLVSKEGK